MLSDADIARIASTPCAVAGSYVHTFARAIEAEVRKDDETLIRQMLDFAELVKRGLEQGTVKAQPIIEIDDDAPDFVIKTLHGEATSAITAARARLEKAP